MSYTHLRRGRPVLFKTLSEQVLNLKKFKAKKTYIGAELHLRKLNAYFGEMLLKDITELTWGQYVLACKTDNPTRKLGDDKKYMSQVIRVAIGERIIHRPLKLEVPDLPSEVGREITEEELRRLYENAGPELSFQIEIAVKMGLRQKEMLHLRWDRINWDLRTVRLFAHETKTKRGRQIPINPDVHDRLKQRWERSKSEYIFPRRYTNGLPTTNNNAAWRICKTAAQVKARWHDLRHTCATRMLRRGVKPHVARVYLGMSEHVLTSIYLHLNQDDLWAAAKAMSEVG